MLWGFVGLGVELVFWVLEGFCGWEELYFGVVRGFVVWVVFDWVVELEDIGGLCVLGYIGLLCFVVEVEGGEVLGGGFVSDVWKGVVVSFVFLVVVWGWGLEVLWGV